MRIGDFFASKNGKRLFNYAYCWGACFVIAGAVFKMINFPFSTQLLILGMAIEVFIFFLAGFETQQEDYKWERVYPGLTDENGVATPVSSSRKGVLKSDVNAQLENKVEEVIEQMDTMSSQLTQINSHYSRLLEAMNTKSKGKE